MEPERSRTAARAAARRARGVRPGPRQRPHAPAHERKNALL